MINAIINITATFVSLKGECDEGSNGFFHSQLLYAKSISACLNHRCCLSILSDKLYQQLLWNHLLDHKSMPEAFAMKCTGKGDSSKQ